MTSPDLVLEHLRRWAEELVDLTRKNRLLYFKHNRSTSFQFEQPSDVVERGLDGNGWGVFLPEPPPKDPDEPYRPGIPASNELVVSMSPPKYGPEILRGITGLARRAQAEYLDSGLWVLWVGLGQLRWIDADEKEVVSPLLLLPVDLKREGTLSKQWRITLSEDSDAALNPALAVKLEKDFGIVLPSLDDLAEPDFAHALAAVSKAVRSTNWKVEPTAVLTTFTFQKEVIYRDLKANEAVIVEHDLVKLLAEGPASDIAIELGFEPDPESNLDERHPPEEMMCVLDADASQRQCIVAAQGGRSFVMDGPPGTGKSQTITNIIAQLMFDGKSVLFVSEKAAALEVVQRRLAELRLDPFVLALHSRTASRKSVAVELGTALKERPRARVAISSSTVAQLRSDRLKLTKYALAMNRIRLPLDRSLHDVIGRVSQLDAIPGTPVPSVDLGELSPVQFNDLRAAGDQLARSWGVVSRGDGFLWRDLRDRAASAAREAELRGLVRSCADALKHLEASATNVVDELLLTQPVSPSSVDRLIAILRLIDDRPNSSPSLLARDDFDSVRNDLRALAGAMTSRASTHAELDSKLAAWRDLDASIGERLDASVTRIEQVASPRLGPLATWTVQDLIDIDGQLAELQTQIGLLRQPLAIFREAFGVSADDSIGQARRLSALGSFAGSPDAPEPTWLNPVLRPMLDEARRVLAELLQTFRALRESLSTTFNEDVLELDLKALRVRFSDVHKGIRKLGSAYRADKKLLASKTVSGKVNDATLSRLDDAIEWQELAERLSLAENKHSGTLGSFYSSRDSADFSEVERSIQLVDAVLLQASTDVDATALERQLARGGQPDSRLPQAVNSTTAILIEIDRCLADHRLSAAADELQTLALDHLAEWLVSARAELDALRLSVIEVCGQGGSIGQARELTQLLAQESQINLDIAALVDACEEVLDELGHPADADQLVASVEWSETVRASFGGPLPRRTASAFAVTSLRSTELTDRVGTFDKSLDAVIGVFLESYGSELRSELVSSFDSGTDLLGELERTVADIGEWESFSEAIEYLDAEGWRPVVESCIEQRIEATSVAGAVERAVLQRWADQRIDEDADLQPKRASARDALLDEFRAFDADLVHSAAARVVNACAERRPTLLVGEAGAINQQAQLKRRHKPVRDQLLAAGETAQRLKPCFMMSPLSVSQFLPASFRFDVVIFDEASQVREADAVCCLYRGTQLIVAGDQKQLPPTSFFDRMTDDDEDIDDNILDFESVLDRCKAQGFTGLPLNWHYRSQHESLITFSNRSFYDGRLATFPGAVFEDPSLGVELFQVNGAYQRGGTRDNPIEADAVVDRIVFHRQRHPEMTLGVVALSVAQQVAIEAAIERRSATEPELADLVSDDRLDGFFVKNLENVQGDERDLIVMSIGYGPDELGKFTMNFGPMNRAGGERRLNVAVTRARRRVEVVASFGPEQIQSTNQTIQHLRRYLDYAKRGIAALALEMGDLERDTDSPFEDEVIRSARQLGYDVTPQVGVAGYRIDIGVKHPGRPGSYVLGIECDGATYHSSKVARDRDRLRQQVLEGLGWRIHRIWSTAWFSDRATEEERLRVAIEAAIGVEDHARFRPREARPEIEIDVDEHDFDVPPAWTVVYTAPVAERVRGWNDFNDPGARPLIADGIRSVVGQAGPISRDDVITAVRAAWGLERAGTRIRQAYMAAESMARSKGELIDTDGFLTLPGNVIVVRVPAPDSLTPRKVAAVDPRELKLAIVSLLRDAGTMGFSELRLSWARLFGWRRVGTDIELAFERAVRDLQGAGSITTGDRVALID